jgi:hypothetical protein
MQKAIAPPPLPVRLHPPSSREHRLHQILLLDPGVEHDRRQVGEHQQHDQRLDQAVDADHPV